MDTATLCVLSASLGSVATAGFYHLWMHRVVRNVVRLRDERDSEMGQLAASASVALFKAGEFRLASAFEQMATLMESKADDLPDRVQ